MFSARSADDHESSVSRALLLGAASMLAVLLLAVGFGTGRATAREPGASAAPDGALPPAAPSSVADGVGPSRILSGVPEGYAHSRDGALAAARGVLRIEVSDLQARPDAYRAAWREMCAPDYYASAGRDEAETVLTQQEANNHLISNAAHGQQVYERAFPLTAGVISYSNAHAVIRVWDLLVAHPGDGPTVLSFHGGTVELRWTGGDWKLDGGASSSATSDGSSGSLRLDDGPGLPSYLSQLQGVDDAPPSS